MDNDNLFSDKVINSLWTSLVIVLIVGAVSAAFVPLYETIVADGKIDYCYIDVSTYEDPFHGRVNSYHVVGHRPWRSDRWLVSTQPTLQAAKDEADKINCPLK